MKNSHILQSVKDIVMTRCKLISNPLLPSSHFLLPPLRQIPHQLGACQINNHTVPNSSQNLTCVFNIFEF